MVEVWDGLVIDDNFGHIYGKGLLTQTTKATRFSGGGGSRRLLGPYGETLFQ